MSMPIITSSGVTRCDAITDIIESVALQQTGLSHILNAEGEKIQLVLKLAKTPEELLAVNESVESMVNSITRLEAMLQGKLQMFKNCLCVGCEKEDVTKITLDVILENETGATLNTKGENVYIFSPGETESIVNFVTNPDADITLLTELPDGFKFENGILYITNDVKWDQTYELTFLIGSGDNAYTVTFYATPNA